MQITFSPLLSAPQSTGHPLGLPDAQQNLRIPIRVKPVVDAHSPDAQLTKGQSPVHFWRAVNGQPDPAAHIAPPSILQIAIDRLLDEQSPEASAKPTLPGLPEAADPAQESTPTTDSPPPDPQSVVPQPTPVRRSDVGIARQLDVGIAPKPGFDTLL
jgi:hypothetical protein